MEGVLSTLSRAIKKSQDSSKYVDPKGPQKAPKRIPKSSQEDSKIPFERETPKTAKICFFQRKCLSVNGERVAKSTKMDTKEASKFIGMQKP